MRTQDYFSIALWLALAIGAVLHWRAARRLKNSRRPANYAQVHAQAERDVLISVAQYHESYARSIMTPLYSGDSITRTQAAQSDKHTKWAQLLRRIATRD